VWLRLAATEFFQLRWLDGVSLKPLVYAQHGHKLMGLQPQADPRLAEKSPYRRSG
jgi:hypothetical protein